MEQLDLNPGVGFNAEVLTEVSQLIPQLKQAQVHTATQQQDGRKKPHRNETRTRDETEGHGQLLLDEFEQVDEEQRSANRENQLGDRAGGANAQQSEQVIGEKGAHYPDDDITDWAEPLAFDHQSA
jgi:hypothetical protein